MYQENSEETHHAPSRCSFVSPYEGLFSHSLTVGHFIDSAMRDRILVLCAEPGMGKTTLMRELRAQSEYRGWKYYDFSLCGYTPKDASAYIARKSYDISRCKNSIKQRIVFFDDVPESDEAQVVKQARAFSRLRAAGCAVVVACLPEAAQLIEEIPNCLVFSALELLLDESNSPAPESAKRKAAKLTRGVPLLVGSLREEMLCGDTTKLSIGYQEALLSLIFDTVRETLCHEELIARSTLLLLGKGTFQDIETVLGKRALEYMPYFEANVPYFGVDNKGKRFSCILNSRADLLEDCVPKLKQYVPFMMAYLQKIALLLKERHEYKRLSLACTLLGEAYSWNLVLPDAAELIDAGETHLVSNVFLTTRNRDVLSRTGMRALEHALSCVVQGRTQNKDFDDTVSAKSIASPESLVNACALLASARMLVVKPLPFLAGDIDEQSSMVQRLMLHRQVFSLVRVGRLADAYRLLSLEIHDDCKMTLSSACITIDREILRILLGIPQPASSVRLDEALGFLRTSDVMGLRSYIGIVQSLRLIEQEETDVASIYQVERYASQAEERGDVIAQVVELLAVSILDLRNKAYPRAYVHANNALVLAQKVRCDYLAETGFILSGVSRFMLGESPKEQETRPVVNPSLYEAYKVIVNAMDSFSGCGSLKEPRMSAESAPQNALWLIRALVKGIGQFSDELAKCIPESWKRAMGASLQKNSGSINPHSHETQHEIQHETQKEAGSTQASPHRGIRLSILGGFSVTVNGVPVPESMFGKRYAKLLLIYLALSRKHTAPRHAIIDALWPNCTYGAGVEKIYQATRVIRQAIASIDETCNPIISIRGEKTVMLNDQIFTVDIDRFEEIARIVPTVTDDEELVHLAQEVRCLYRGDVYVPTDDAFSYVETVRRNFCQKYIDIMTIGSEAALRLERYKLAVLLAENAVLVDEYKESSIIALVKAMRACGRSAEAQRCYDDYVRRCLQQENRIPSKELRIIAGDIRDKSHKAEPLRIEDSYIEVAVE